MAHSSYAARPAAIGTTVMVRIFERRLEIRDLKTQALLRTHTLAERPGSVELPEDERVFNPSRQTRQILAQAQAIGADAQRLCQLLFSVEGRVGQRKLWGIVNLAQRHPRQIVNAACAQALDDGVYSYRHVKLVVEKRVAQALQQLEQPTSDAQAPELRTTQSHNLIRSPQEYGELFAQAAATAAAVIAAAANQGDLFA
ncbi:hypothetical protein ROSA5918_26345 [Roseateles saccharophilus]